VLASFLFPGQQLVLIVYPGRMRYQREPRHVSNAQPAPILYTGLQLVRSVPRVRSLLFWVRHLSLPVHAVQQANSRAPLAQSLVRLVPLVLCLGLLVPRYVLFVL